MLADGYDMVLDLDKSQGRRLWDARSGRWMLDMFSFFATLPVGLNHPRLKEPEFLARLTRAALANPANSDIYTVEFAEFVDAFGRIAAARPTCRTPSSSPAARSASRTR